MGRLAILLLVIVTIIVLWKAFGPKTWNNDRELSGENPFPPLGRGKKKEVQTRGPDDDPDFLWNIKKERFKAQREAERREQEAVERARRGEHWDPGAEGTGSTGGTSSSEKPAEASSADAPDTPDPSVSDEKKNRKPGSTDDSGKNTGKNSGNKNAEGGA